jgi:hypothetical protein
MIALGMKLEDPLLNLVDRCQTICVAECCGIGAYDFSPVHIASSLLIWEGKPSPERVAKLRSQLDALKANYGNAVASSSGITIDDMNQSFSAAEVEALVGEIAMNLDIALRLCEDVESTRFKGTDQGASADAGGPRG